MFYNHVCGRMGNEEESYTIQRYKLVIKAFKFMYNKTYCVLKAVLHSRKRMGHCTANEKQTEY
jgi:hypothetical protein